MPMISARWPAELARRDSFSSSQAPSVSSSHTPAISTLTATARSSCGAMSLDSRSSVAAFEAVQEPAGRSSSASPDDVAVNRGAVAKMIFLPQIAVFLGCRLNTYVDLPQSGGCACALQLTQIKWRFCGLIYNLMRKESEASAMFKSGELGDELL